jgi:hypothetical protein
MIGGDAHMGERVEGERKGVQLMKIREWNEIEYRGKGGEGSGRLCYSQCPCESLPKVWGSSSL